MSSRDHDRVLTPDEIEAFGARMDAIREAARRELGARDAEHIRSMIRLQRRAEIAGRALLFAGILPPAWVAGTALLSLSKILENMEIGHNVMHGQYEFLGDPTLRGRDYEWDTACPGDQWRHSHNVVHHTYTNVVGKDRDVGYGILRVTDQQPWNPGYLLQPLHAIALMLFFQWGVALHDLEVEKIRTGEKSLKQVLVELRAIAKKGGKQVLKDYLLFPLLAGPFFVPVLAGNVTANLVRNIWAFLVIFCGHFTEGVAMYDVSTLEGETRGAWYLRQLRGSSNLEGGRVMHLLSGHLSHQIEHHLFPDIPAHRYPEMAEQVRAVAAEYGQHYETGTLGAQLLTVAKRLLVGSLPSANPRLATPRDALS